MLAPPQSQQTGPDTPVTGSPRREAQQRRLFWLWTAALAATVIGSLMPADLVDRLDVFDLRDAVQHFSAYFLLALLPPLWSRSRATAIRVCCTMPLLGVLLEYLQQLTPDRSFQYEDMVANTVGTVVGALCGFTYYRWHRPRWRGGEAA